MVKVDKKTKYAIAVCSCLAAVSLLFFAFLRYGATPLFDELFLFAMLVAITPLAILNYIEYKWRKSIDEHLPDLFRSIVQAEETGIILPQALEDASKRNYGPLTVEMRKMTAQISWGMTFEEALLAFSRRINTILVQRTVPLILAASRSGGHVERVFDPMGKFVQTTLLLEKERRTQTRPYIAIIYVAFFVFLFTIVLLFKSFFVSVEGLPVLGTAVMNPEAMRRIFFHMTIVQSFFGGLVAGKMGEGTISAGLKHSIVLMIVGYVALKVFL